MFLSHFDDIKISSRVETTKLFRMIPDNPKKIWGVLSSKVKRVETDRGDKVMLLRALHKLIVFWLWISTYISVFCCHPNWIDLQNLAPGGLNHCVDICRRWKRHMNRPINQYQSFSWRGGPCVALHEVFQAYWGRGATYRSMEEWQHFPLEVVSIVVVKLHNLDLRWFSPQLQERINPYYRELTSYDGHTGGAAPRQPSRAKNSGIFSGWTHQNNNDDFSDDMGYINTVTTFLNTSFSQFSIEFRCRGTEKRTLRIVSFFVGSIAGTSCHQIWGLPRFGWCRGPVSSVFSAVTKGPGEWRIFVLVSRNPWWSNMTKFDTESNHLEMYFCISYRS